MRGPSLAHLAAMPAATQTQGAIHPGTVSIPGLNPPVSYVAHQTTRQSEIEDKSPTGRAPMRANT
jgi:hypothetical protein